MLPLAYRWRVRCAKCRHAGEVTAAVAELAVKLLRCEACGHRQAFTPVMVTRAPRRPNGRRIRAARQALAKRPDELNDPVSDLWQAG